MTLFGRPVIGRSWVVCTSIYDEAPPAFVAAFKDNFAYYGMRFAGAVNANCEDGYDPSRHDALAREFAHEVKHAHP